MTRKRGGDGDPSTFAEAMKGVKKIPERDKTLPPTTSEPARRPAHSDPPVEFEISGSGERIEARAAGIDRRHLRRLRSGAVPIDVRVDLHGLDASAARASLRETLTAAWDAGQRCALVIHGRGRHSQGEPVLKQALAEWLAEPPVGARVMAFATATPEHGGAGATYVLLRRRTAKNAGRP